MSLAVSSRKALHEWRLYAFILPSLAMVVIFAYYPALSAVYHSFYNWKGGDSAQFTGLENFRRLLHDASLWKSFGTVTVLAVANVFKLLPSMFLAVLIHRLRSDLSQYWYRVLVVVPMIVPGLVTLFIWKFFFDPNFGILNRLLDLTRCKGVLVWLDQHLLHWEVFQSGVPIPWLNDPHLILPSLILWGFPWIGSVGVLIYLSGLQSIGEEIYEAANLDGAGSWGRFRYIELPLLMTQVRISLVLLIIGTLQGFGLQLLLLGPEGGAGGRGMVPGLWMYRVGFIEGEFGYACAVGLTLFAFILVLTLINNRYVRVDK